MTIRFHEPTCSQVGRSHPKQIGTTFDAKVFFNVLQVDTFCCAQPTHNSLIIQFVVRERFNGKMDIVRLQVPC